MKKEEELAAKIFELVKDFEGDPVDFLEGIAQHVIRYQEKEREELRKKNEAEMRKVANEIFELCPVCNFIPVVIETQYEDVCVTHPDYEDILDSCYDYLLDQRDRKADWVMPHQDDDITFGNWKKIVVLWKKMIELAGYKYHNDKSGDYCYEYHLSVGGFCKESQQIEWCYDINR